MVELYEKLITSQRQKLSFVCVCENFSLKGVALEVTELDSKVGKKENGRSDFERLNKKQEGAA